MKKTTKLAKRVLSVVLALSIVLSFAMASVSAMPGSTPVIGDVVTQGFENDNNMIAKLGNTKMERVTDSTLAHSGNGSLKFTEDGGTYNLIKFSFTPSGVAFEPDSNYYLSFWYKASQSVNLTNLMDSANAGLVNKSYTTVAGEDGWMKAIIHIATNPSISSKSFNVGAWKLSVGTTIYIDDLEFAKVENFDEHVNTVPKGGVVNAEKQRVMNFESGDGKLTVFNAEDKALSKKYSYSGLQSFAFTPQDATLEIASYAIKNRAGFTLNTNSSWYPFNINSECVTYVSVYAYSENPADISVLNIFGSKYLPPVTIPANKWTKISAVIPKGYKSNAIFFGVENSVGNTVYFDELMVAEIAAVDPVIFYDVNAEFSSDDTAVVKATSTVALKSATISAPEGVTASDVVISEDGTEVTFNVSGLASNTTYELSVSASDVFRSDAVSAPVAFTTPMTISASSIADGATDVLAPVDYILIDTPAAVIEDTVTVDKFTFNDGVAKVSAVSVADGRIKVEIEGIYNSETYTLSVDGVEAVNGAILRDSITFTTRSAVHGWKLDFDSLREDDDGNLIIPSYLTTANATTMPISPSTDDAYNGTYSLKVSACNQAGGYVMLWFNQTKAGKMYKISFYIKSTNWNANNTGKDIFDETRGVTTGTPVIEETDKEGWRKVTVFYTSTNGGSFLKLWGMGGEVIYLDDIKVSQVDNSISNPVMFNDGAIVNTIAAGTTNVTLATATDMTASKAYAVQYNADGKMIQVVPATITADAITFAVTSTDAVKTKLIFMDGTSFAPVINYIQFN